ncbi:3-hydroxyacyl-ACP dehydratase FabZ [Advenella mimigardefordensis]|uniref:3-hydroxyacyl-[acyl-carrier-protein] dehydratase FabZ n=1 Tax=Advenella mimigardefordensis (strain DSM 17166 / LMG 22922 / DPN7) TaxID=1247726 RepID=W0PAY9_ADVMD|nr:3-hydroxyacyl-ACP dehydratase FabZ [Advenella mimigardefordensis]AHG64024.1 (3R)-hydroxymyristoyl-[acyl-carrier-protein] dehydratase [Advenella mimigardefordensis DPN7]
MQVDIQGIMARLPHRYPMLLVDRVLKMVPGKSIIAIKNVTVNEPFFNGHFPGRPVMPGVLIIEAMAQAAAIFSFAEEDGSCKHDISRKAYYLVGVDGARFRKPVIPGDQLQLEVTADRISKVICKYSARATVDGAVVAEAAIMCAIRDLDEQ